MPCGFESRPGYHPRSRPFLVPTVPVGTHLPRRSSAGFPHLHLLSLSTADAAITAAQLNDSLGLDLGAAGDVDGDGFDEILVGAPYYPAGGGAGAAYLFRGPVQGVRDVATADASALHTGGHLFGSAVGGAGDLDGDGRSDVVVGAPLLCVGCLGTVYVFYGSGM